ncbi:MAG TPA: adenylate/guanylate cyclase domain-containing protein [Rhizomicrobium sp.]|nr:adenylate/guanylate cyclase domain-containing protein [Rhizomicrobium sp.]
MAGWVSMMLRDRPFVVWGLPFLALVIALAVLGTDLGGVATRLRGVLFDTYMTSQPRSIADTRAAAGHPVKVLDFDAPAVERFGAWPWPNATTASLIAALKAEGAFEVVFLRSFDKPDGTSPKSLIGLVPPGPSFDSARSALEQMPSPDDALAAGLAGIRSVTGFTLGAARGLSVPAPKATVTWGGNRNPFGRVQDFHLASGSLAPIEAASGGVGALNLVTDPDGLVRRMPLVFVLGDKPVPTVDAEMLRLAEGRDALHLKGDDGNSGLFGGTPGIASIETSHGDLATRLDGSIWIDWAGPDAGRNVSAAAVMDRTLPPQSLGNAIVYVGDPGDLVATPTGLRSVAEVHAEAAESLLSGMVLRRPAAAAQAELLCLLLFGFGCAVLIARFGIGPAAVFVVAVVAGAGYASWRLFAADHVLFDAAGLSAGVAAVWLTGAGARSLEVLTTRARLKHAFADVLPPRVIEQLARTPGRMRLEGETRTVSYLACGVREFSELASSFRGDPAAFTRLMKLVLEPLMNEALNRGGAIDKLSSDGFTAFWNAPLDDPEHAIHACEAANGMMEAIARTNEIIVHERRIDGVAMSPVEIGVGISSGPAIAGGFKAHGRTAFSVNGDCTLMASRIQQISGQYGPAVIVSEETRKASERGFAYLEVDFIQLEGSDDPVKLYAMLGNPVMRASPKFRALATFHDHIFQSLRAQQWQKARELIEQCRRLSGASQKLYDLHLARIAYFEDKPPGDDWDGAFRPILK